MTTEADATETLRHRFPPESDTLGPSFEITVVSGPDEGAAFHIVQENPSPTLVGSSVACPARLTDTSVSRRHASLEATKDGLRLRDLGSTNGTFVGTMRVHDVVLQGGETVRLGSTDILVTRAAPKARPPLSARTSFGLTLGESEEMRRLYPLLERIALSEVPVILEGETGTGKEVLAESLHMEGPRRGGPFVVFDCTTVPANLLESALFGHEKGAFTGALSSRVGVFEQAHGGTLLIDEIGDLDLMLQPKLLRAIQRSEIQRVGGTKWIKANVRILAATRRDLDKEVVAGRFRDDLFYRLNVARIELPPLRRRRGDIAVLTRRFWTMMGGNEKEIPPGLVARFEDYAWPGNIRELYNAVARHLALGDLARWVDNQTSSEEPQDEARESKSAEASEESTDIVRTVLESDLGLVDARERVVRDFERRYLRHLLARHGTVTRAAEAAGIARRYFHQLLQKLEIQSREGG